MAAQPEQSKIERSPNICVVSILDHIPGRRGKTIANPGFSRIVVDRTLEGPIRLTLYAKGNRERLHVPADHAGEAMVQLLTGLGAEFVVVSCNGDVNLEKRAIAEAAAIGARSDAWAVQYDLALGGRSGFTYSFADFVQYRMIDLHPPLPQKNPSILGSFLLRTAIFQRHAGEILLLPSATVWHRLMAMRLVSLYGAPLLVPIVAGWRRHRFGLRKIDGTRHNLAALSAFVDRTLAEATEMRDVPGNLKFTLALQACICRLLLPDTASSGESRLPDSAVNAIGRSIDAALTDRSFRMVLAADIVDQMSLSSLKGLEYAPAVVRQKIGASFSYAVETNAFAGLEIGKDKLIRLAQMLLDESPRDAQVNEPIAPNVLLLVSALSQSKSGTLRDLLVDNLSRLVEPMDLATSVGVPENRIARLRLETRAITRAILISSAEALNLVPVAFWVRKHLRGLKLIF